MDFPCYTFILPMPVSVNAMHDLTQAKKIWVNGKQVWTRNKVRSAEYREWCDLARIRFTQQFRDNWPVMFNGRLAMHCIFMWNAESKNICDVSTSDLSDIDNRIKTLADFLQKKIYPNDSAIDEHHHVRRIVQEGEDRVKVRVYEIPDRRYDDHNLIF